MVHSLLYRITILDLFCFQLEKVHLINISRGSKFQTSLKLTYLWNSKERKRAMKAFSKKTKENEKIEKVHSTGN